MNWVFLATLISFTFISISMEVKLVSACLLGLPCRYDGVSKENEYVIELSKKEVLIPVCPEQLGGLPTPREPAELRGDKVYTKSKTDLTENYQKGAMCVLAIAELYGIKEAILKQRSPSCGSGQVKLFSGEIVKCDGITTALLKLRGINVISEEELSDII